MKDAKFACPDVARLIHFDTYGYRAGKNLHLTFRKEPAPPALSLRTGGTRPYDERCFGLLSYLLQCHTGRPLRQRHPSPIDCEDAEIGDHHIDHALAGERQGASPQQFWFITCGMLDQNNDPPDAGD